MPNLQKLSQKKISTSFLLPIVENIQKPLIIKHKKVLSIEFILKYDKTNCVIKII